MCGIDLTCCFAQDKGHRLRDGNMFEYIQREKCPVCDCSESTFIGAKQGHFVSQGFQVYRCIRCDCVYVKNPIHPKHLMDIYNAAYFSGEGMDTTVNYQENLSRQEWFFEKYDFQIGAQIRQYRIKEGYRWLDVGCALGNVLDWARDRYGVETYGVELSEYARQIAGSRGHIILL